MILMKIISKLLKVCWRVTMVLKVVPHGLNRCSEALEKIRVQSYVGYWPIGVFIYINIYNNNSKMVISLTG